MRSRLPSMKMSCSMPTWKLRLMNRNHELSEYKLGLLFWSNFLCGRRNFSHRLSEPLHLWKEEYDCWSHLCCSYRNRAPLPQEPFAVVRITSTWACGYIYISISAEWEKIKKINLGSPGSALSWMTQWHYMVLYLKYCRILQARTCSCGSVWW